MTPEETQARILNVIVIAIIVISLYAMFCLIFGTRLSRYQKFRNSQVSKTIFPYYRRHKREETKALIEADIQNRLGVEYNTPVENYYINLKEVIIPKIYPKAYQDAESFYNVLKKQKDKGNFIGLHNIDFKYVGLYQIVVRVHLFVYRHDYNPHLNTSRKDILRTEVFSFNYIRQNFKWGIHHITPVQTTAYFKDGSIQHDVTYGHNGSAELMLSYDYANQTVDERYFDKKGKLIEKTTIPLTED